VGLLLRLGVGYLHAASHHTSASEPVHRQIGRIYRLILDKRLPARAGGMRRKWRQGERREGAERERETRETRESRAESREQKVERWSSRRGTGRQSERQEKTVPSKVASQLVGDPPDGLEAILRPERLQLLLDVALRDLVGKILDVQRCRRRVFDLHDIGRRAPAPLPLLIRRLPQTPVRSRTEATGKGPTSPSSAWGWPTKDDDDEDDDHDDDEEEGGRGIEWWNERRGGPCHSCARESKGGELVHHQQLHFLHFLLILFLLADVEGVEAGMGERGHTRLVMETGASGEW